MIPTCLLCCLRHAGINAFIALATRSVGNFPKQLDRGMEKIVRGTVIKDTMCNVLKREERKDFESRELRENLNPGLL